MDRIITPTKIIYLKSKGEDINLISAKLDRELMTSDIAYYKINSSKKLDLKINDYVEIFGRKYKINKRPTEQKLSESEYVYDVEFEGLMYDLAKCKFFNYDANGYKTSSEFSLTANIEGFLLVIKNNLQRISTKWEIGHFTNGETKTISFSKDDCFSALQRICDEFKIEFSTVEINNKYYIHTGNFGTEYPYIFEYGKGKGLYNLKLQSADDKSIITRAYVTGGTENLPEAYRNYSTNLLLPDNADCLEDSSLIGKYGIIEGFIEFPEIYPHRTGVVSSIFSDNVLKFVDNSMDFDLNEKETDGVTTKYLIPGTNAKVFFNTGNLAGYQFEIKKYDHTTKIFDIVAFTNEEKLTFPSSEFEAFQIQEGDEYVLIDIYMPESYVTNAENELLEKAVTEFEKLKEVKVSYDLNIDKDFLKITNSLPFDIGDKLKVKDDDLMINKSIRINNISYDFIEKTIKVSLADSYEMGTIRQLNFEVKKLDVNNSVKTQSQILQEQRIKDVEIKTNFLEETTVSGNVVATGLLMVGDENGANAGISGVTDLGAQSVRFFAGGTASNRNNARYQVLDDGTVKMNHSDGKKGWVWAIKDGAPLLEYWSKTGAKLFELGERGLVAVSYVPESFTEEKIYQCSYTNPIFNETTLKSELQSAVIKQTIPPLLDDNIYTFNYLINSNKTAYDYYNGTHPDYEVYSVYNGLKDVNNDRTYNIANGWYFLEVGIIHTAYNDKPTISPQNITIILYYFENGKQIDSRILTITK